MGLSQAEFAARFQIPLGTLRDWEQNRREPDPTARAYLRVIEHNPADVVGDHRGGCICPPVTGPHRQ